MYDIKIDLNEATKDYKNESGEFIFIKNAIKSAIIDAKLDNGSDKKVTFIYRNSNNKPLDLFVNTTADNLIKDWNRE